MFKQTTARLLASLLVCASLVACTDENYVAHKPSPLTKKKYASMAPSNTELIYALGGQDNLIAVCTQCDYPVQAKDKPKMGSFESVDVEKLTSMHPDFVFLVDGQEALESTIQNQFIKLHCIPVTLHNQSVRSVAVSVKAIGNRIGKDFEARQLAKKYDDAIDALQKLCFKSANKPKVFICVWPEPLVAAGANSYLSDAITVCGGTNIAGDIHDAYPHYDTERLVSAQPDIIIMPHEAEGQDFYKRPPWTSLKAVANNHVYFLPSREDDRLSRPTLRLVSGLYWLAAKIHPELAPQLKQLEQSPQTTVKN